MDFLKGTGLLWGEREGEFFWDCVEMSRMMLDRFLKWVSVLGGQYSPSSLIE
jgi:hypothetical protein